MSENATIFFVYGCVVLFLVFLMLFDKKGSQAVKGAAIFIFMCIVGLLFAIAFYNKGQVNKTLPNLQARGCKGKRVLQYPLGVDYHADVAKLERSQRNTHCQETITVLYPGNNRKVITLSKK